MSNTINQYDDANFTTLRQANLGAVQAGVSSTNFGHFRSRNAAVVRMLHVRIASAASLAAGSLAVCRLRNAPSNTSLQTIASYSLVSATSAGSIFSVTLGTLNTLTSISDAVCCTLITNDKGKWELTYEYQLLPASDMTIIS